MEKPKILILYMPVIHEGYLNIFRRLDFVEILILDKGVINFLTESGFEYLSRDLRMLHPETVTQLIGTIFNVRAIHLENLQNPNLENFEIHIPNDEIGRFIAERFLKKYETNIVLDDYFLRWHKQISDKENEVIPNVIISQHACDQMFMDKAFKEAKKSSDWWRQVGSVFVSKNAQAVVSFNQHMPHEYITEIEGNSRADFGPGQKIELVTAIHAEASVIAKAARDGLSTKEGYLYVTTFPCPVCARLIVEAGISKVFYRDGYSLFDGQRILKEGNVEIVLVK